MTKNTLLEKGPQNSGMGIPPPLFGQCPKENFFLIDTPVSEDSEVEGEEEVLVKEELVEEDAKPRHRSSSTI